MDRPETSVNSYERTLCNIPEERKPRLHRDGTYLVSRTFSMRMDGRTDMTKLIITFWNGFANAPRKFLRQKRVPHREHNAGNSGCRGNQSDHSCEG
jgi:hypothetical protein